MDFQELSQLTFDGLQAVLSEHNGVETFVREREKFDCWLKIEFCRVLVQNGVRPDPTGKKIDVTFPKWAVDVRTLNTNIPHDKCEKKGRPIKKEVDSLIKDIWKLTTPGGSIKAPNRAVLFAVYPTTHENERWQSVHMNQLRTELTRLEYREFELPGQIPGVLYFGLCSDL